MEQSVKMTPKDFFLHLGVVATLYVSTVAFISFVFAVINLALPDVAAGAWVYENSRSSIAWSLSVFIIVYPVFLYLLFKVSHYLLESKERAAVSIRKWFIYLTIFLTAATLIVDGIVLLTTFLQGEQLTLRFVLKVLTIVIVALTIFWFSIKELRNTFITNPKTLTRAAVGTSLFVLVCIIVGFAYMGSPRQARLALEDAQRVQDLSYIQSEIIEYWRATETLPTSLEAINDPIRYVQVPVDAVTKEPYEYNVLSATSFEFCAVFATSNADSVAVMETSIPALNAFTEDDTHFMHDAGRTCFTRTIDPARITPYPAKG
ncbi:MAG: hypothetical protein RL150_341 [Candidatus Parcubacteria bacterium]|jgi:hypothetical protein